MNPNISMMVAFVCNPFLAVLFKRNYERYWKDEVDEMLIHVNGRNDKIREFITQIWKNDDKAIHVDSCRAELRQGEAFNRLFPMANGKVLATMDSDNMVYKKGIVSDFSGYILAGTHDCVGSIGMHAHPSNVAKALFSRYGIVRLNPYMSFWNNSIVHKIRNITFKNFTFVKGEKFDFLDQPMPVNGFLDAMTKFSIQFMQLSKKKPKIIETGSLGEYLHISAISSIFRRCFRNMENTNEQKYVETGHVQPLSYLAWNYLIYEATKDQVPFEDFKKEYEEGFKIEMMKRQATIDDVKKMAEGYLKAHKLIFE